MKKNFVIALFLLIGISACVPYMYGVPKESWDRMSEPERMEAMRSHERSEQARRQSADERARIRAIEEQTRRQAAEERARNDAWAREQALANQAALERERNERAYEKMKRESEYQLTAPFIAGKTLRWESDALGGQKGTVYVTSTNGSSFYLDQINYANKAAGIVKLEGRIRGDKVFIENRRWNETWVGSLRNGAVYGKINHKFTFRISE